MSREYFLRTCAEDGTSHGGFRWPLDIGAEVEAPDWAPAPVCGNGLHGIRDGAGDGVFLSLDPDAVWMVFSADAGTAIDLGGKSKVGRARVEYVGDRSGAADFLVAHGADPAKCIGYTITGGDYATLTGGDYATLTGGNYAALTGGDYAALTGGNRATLTGGNRATLTGGDGATLTGGDGATLTGGDYATLTGGDYATFTGKWWDEASNRYRIAVGYVGEGGIEAGHTYRIDGRGCFLAVEEPGQ